MAVTENFELVKQVEQASLGGSFYIKDFAGGTLESDFANQKRELDDRHKAGVPWKALCQASDERVEIRLIDDFGLILVLPVEHRIVNRVAGLLKEIVYFARLLKLQVDLGEDLSRDNVFADHELVEVIAQLKPKALNVQLEMVGQFKVIPAGNQRKKFAELRSRGATSATNKDKRQNPVRIACHSAMACVVVRCQLLEVFI